jgi:WD40 repeat protein
MNTIASGHQDGGVRFWDMISGERTHLIPKFHSLHVTGMSFHPRDGNTLLSGSKDSSLKLLDYRSLEEVQVGGLLNPKLSKAMLTRLVLGLYLVV